EGGLVPGGSLLPPGAGRPLAPSTPGAERGHSAPDPELSGRALRARGTPGPLLRGCYGVPGLPALAGERPRAQAQDRIDLPLCGAPGSSGPRVAHADSLPRSGSALGRLSHARLAGEGGYGEARRSARGPLAQRWKPEPRRPGVGDHPQAPHPAPEADLLEPKKRPPPMWNPPLSHAFLSSPLFGLFT